MTPYTCIPIETLLAVAVRYVPVPAAREENLVRSTGRKSISQQSVVIVYSSTVTQPTRAQKIALTGLLVFEDNRHVETQTTGTPTLRLASMRPTAGRDDALA